MNAKYGLVSGKYGIDMSELGPFFDPKPDMEKTLDDRVEKLIDPKFKSSEITGSSSSRKPKKKQKRKTLNLPKIEESSKMQFTTEST